jgi:peptide deformylase
MKFFYAYKVPILTSHTAEPPPYVCMDDPMCTNKNILQEPAKPVEFPLNNKMQQALSDLVAKYDAEKMIAGLAVTQIGHPYRMIIFAVPDDPVLKKIRPDLEQTMQKTVWFNPSYTPLSPEKRKDIEGCFSVLKYVGPVERYTHIAYKATTEEGKEITGEASGYLARVIQHEIDHLNGKMCLNHVKENEKIDREEYITERKKLQVLAKKEFAQTQSAQARQSNFA